MVRHSKFVHDKNESYALYKRPRNALIIYLKLTNQEAAQFISASDFIKNIDFIIKKKEEVYFNSNDFHDFIFKAENLNNHVENRQNYIHFNRYFLNFLNSWRIYIDFLEAFVKKLMNDEFERFKKETNKLFDTNFTYRFLYNLRNYSEHISYPIQIILANNAGSKFEPLFIRNELLMHESMKPKHFKNDYKLLNEIFPVLPHMTEGLNLLEYIEKIFFGLFRNKIIESINQIDSLIKEDNICLGIKRPNSDLVDIQGFDRKILYLIKEKTGFFNENRRN
ncbi:MAG: hypothetical protein V4683_04230 [Bacteroidota bacterium]